MSRVRRWSLVGALGLALAGGASVAADLLVRTWPLERLPMWDAAGNGWGAVELWAALADGRLGELVLRLNAQDTWPFGFSLLLLPFVAVAGGSFESAALLPALAFALVPALLVWLGHEIDGDGRGLAAGLVAGVLWLSSPLPRALATVSLRETTGAALGIAALAAYLRARRLGALGAWRVTGALLLGLSWTKYNYFLSGATALALHAVLEAAPERRGVIARNLRERIVRGGWRSPARWVAIAIGVAAISLAIGQNPGIFLYACLVVATAALLSIHWKSLARPGRALGRLPPAARGLVELLVVPLWIWSLSPRPIHPRSVIAFLVNRPGDLPALSPSALAFYPRSLFAHYVTPGALAGAIVALAAVGLVTSVRKGDRSRALALAVAVGAIALELHPLKQDRFLATVAPLLFLLAAVVLARLVSRALPYGALARPIVASALAGLSLCAIFFASSRGGALARLEHDHCLLTAPPELLPALTAVAFWASAGEARRVAFLGGFNELSESAVRWETWRGHGFDRAWAEPLRGLDGGSRPQEIASRLERWLARERPERLVALTPAPGSRRAADADYRRYNAWQETALAELRSRGGWRTAVERPLPRLGLELVVLEPLPAAAPDPN